jgi:hypothetical protein
MRYASTVLVLGRLFIYGPSPLVDELDRRFNRPFDASNGWFA